VSGVTNVESCPNKLCMYNMFGVTNSLSAANKRLIGCAWASSTAFNTAGYSSWANSCPA